MRQDYIELFFSRTFSKSIAFRLELEKPGFFNIVFKVRTVDWPFRPSFSAHKKESLPRYFLGSLSALPVER